MLGICPSVRTLGPVRQGVGPVSNLARLVLSANVVECQLFANRSISGHTGEHREKSGDNNGLS
jgi:hypothetical protein